MKTTKFVAVVALLLCGAEARAQSWSSFAGAFPAFPCQDGWMGCLVGGRHLDPSLQADADGRTQPADLRVGWFDLQATAAFSPFTELSPYAGGPATVAAVPDPVEPEPEPVSVAAANDGVAEAAHERSMEEREAAQQRAAAAAEEAEARRQAEALAKQEAAEAAQARKEADAAAKRQREEEAAALKEAEALKKRAAAAAQAAQAGEQARLEAEMKAAQQRAAELEQQRKAAEAKAAQQQAAEAEAKRKADEEARKKAEADAARKAADEEAKRKAAEEAQKKAEAEAAKKAADEEARRKADEEAKRKADEDRAKQEQLAKASQPGNDGSAMATEPAPGNTAVADGDCSDLTKLEPAALLGKLTDGQTGCLENSLAAAPKMTDKKKISLVLQANAWSKGDKKTWEELVKRHLTDIDQSDPDLCYKYAAHLSRQGPGRAYGVIQWANVALENRTVWTGDTYTSRVYSLFKIRAAAAQMLWQQAETDHAAAPTDKTRDQVDKHRATTKVYAREWYEYAKSAGKDADVALALCKSAAGTADYCEAG